MSTPAILDRLLSVHLSAQQAESVEGAALRVPNPPEVVRLFDIEIPRGGDPDCLLGNRFLCRGGGLLLCGQTGAGKSSLIMQALILWALGKPCFGIQPTRPLKSLLVQAENDLIDLAEFRDGVVKGLELTPEEIAQARERIVVVRENARTSASLVEQTLRPLLREHRPDLLWLDPALAYLGGESNSQKDVGGFLRNLINPLLTEFACGVIVVHHGNKPPSGQERPNWKAGDFAYLGGGSAEWANWARAVIVIRSIGHEEIYELRAAKRGRRVQWKDADGLPASRKYIAWSADPNLIFWREPSPEEIAQLEVGEKVGRPRKLEPVDLLHCIRRTPGQNQAFYKAEAKRVLNSSPTAVQNALKACVAQGWVRFDEEGQEKRYHLTPKGEVKASETPSTTDWNPPPTTNAA